MNIIFPWGLLATGISFYLFHAYNRRIRMRKEERRQHLEELRRQLLENLRKAKEHERGTRH